MTMLKSIVENLVLLPEDRELLKAKRGFTDAAIDALAFKSCGPFLSNADWWPTVPDNCKNILLQKNIVIPYFDPTGNVIYLRAHKYGPEGEHVHVYVPYPYMEDDMETLVITEGEFKAVASCLMGVPAIGLPGIASFAKTNYNRLVELLRKLNPKNIVICFDTEIKDDPQYPKYKADFRKRYDTQFWAYIMAYQLESISNFNTRVAVLPPEWMKNGKIDIDGVLADPNLTDKQYKEVIKKAKTPTQYKYSWGVPRIHASFLERKLDKYFYKGPLEEQFDCYFIRESGERLKRISNFVIKVKYTLFDADGKVQRLCKFYSKYGSSKPVIFQPDVMVSKQMFSKFALEQGDFTYDGNDDHLRHIWKYIFMNQDGRIIKLLNYHGYDENTETWFFKNGAYHKDKFYEYDEDDIVWVNDIGYKLDTNMEDIDPPQLCSDEESSVSLAEILKNLGAALGKDNARLMLGWTLGHFFMPEIINEWRIYPFLFLFGRQQGGKSTIASWISNFFGFEQKGINFHNSSVVGISRIASQMSMIPVWLEEYRTKDPDIGRKNNYLRGIYDRSTIVKGTKSVNHIKTYTARSTLIISGEEHPRDAALNSRCVMFSIFRGQEKQRITPEYEWLEQYKGMFSYIGHYILTHKAELWPKVKTRILEYIASFDNQNITVSTRNKLQMSIISGVVDALLGEDQEFSYYVAQKTEDMEREVLDDQALNIFWDDIHNMYTTGRLKTDIHSFKWEKGKKYLYVWFAGAYAEWEIYYKGLRNDIPSSKQALLEHCKRESYFAGFKNSRIGKRVVSCLVLDSEHPAFPSILNYLEDENIVMSEEDEEEKKDVQSPN